ncbi:hypothetical protein [Zhongshania arctica]|uniref:Uncharacterized protein n=1 Tax=Zhongshania arctica TaxID=3238302 RepID=A0ABV3TXM9_9GAMM
MFERSGGAMHSPTRSRQQKLLTLMTKQGLADDVFQTAYLRAESCFAVLG